MAARKLTLRKDTLAELSTEDLVLVVGGAVQTILPTCGCTGYYPTLFDPCTGQ